MPLISNSTVTRCTPEAAFDYLSDHRSELEWNPRAELMEKITDLPVGVGTRYRAKWKSSPEVEVETIAYVPYSGCDGRRGCSGWYRCHRTHREGAGPADGGWQGREGGSFDRHCPEVCQVLDDRDRCPEQLRVGRTSRVGRRVDVQ